MMQFDIKIGVVISLAISAFTLGCTSFVNAAEKDGTIEQKLRLLLEDEFFIHLDLQGVRWNTSDDILFPPEETGHSQGIYRAYEVHLSKPRWDEWPSVTLYSKSEVRVIDSRSGLFSEEQCRGIATSYLEKHFPEQWKPLKDSEVTTSVPANQLPFQTGIYEFRWDKISAQEDWYLYVRGQIRALDGKVVGFRLFKGRFPPHKITSNEAKKLAMQCAAQKNLKPLSAKIGLLGQLSDDPRIFWAIGVKALDEKTNTIVGGRVEIDSETGAVTNCDRVKWNPIKEKKFYEPYIGTPSWSKQGLTYVSFGLLAGLPDWAPIQPQAILRDSKGQTRYLTADLVSGAHSASSLNTSSWSVVQRQNWTYAFNLETGAYRILGMPERAGETPTIDPEGKWAIVSGTGRDRNTDMDLLPDDLSSRGELLGNRGRLVSKGDDHHPLFSPDNKWLYFVTTSQANGKAVQSLRRIAAELSHTKEVVTLKPTQIETIIPNFAGQVLRLSIFPNGQKMLLQSEKEMLLLSVADKKATPISPKNLQDAEVKAPISQTRDGWAGPSDNEVTFSGKTTDKDDKIRWRIYSCRFDGSNLKAWTPKDNQPVEAYTFPQSPDGKTAIDLAKQWALKEVEFEDYLKRQGQ